MATIDCVAVKGGAGNGSSADSMVVWNVPVLVSNSSGRYRIIARGEKMMTPDKRL